MKTKSSRAGAMFMKSCGARAVTFLGRLRSPEIIQTVAGHIDDPE